MFTLTLLQHLFKNAGSTFTFDRITQLKCIFQKLSETPKGFHSQVKRLLPDRVEVSVDGLCPLFGFAHLDGDVGITGAGFVFGLKALSAQHWEEGSGEKKKKEKKDKPPCVRDDPKTACPSALLAYYRHLGSAALAVHDTCTSPDSPSADEEGFFCSRKCT